MDFEDLSFEWDDRKNTINEGKHGISFPQAALIWDGDYIQGPAKKVNGEERFFVTGKLDDIFITVVCTMRGKNTRLISARRARHEERTEYHKNFPE